MLTLNRAIPSLFKDLLDLIFPPSCPVCHGVLSRGQRYICTECRLTIPLTGFWLDHENVMAERVWRIRPDIQAVAALFYYVPNGGWSRLIHDFKYRGMWRHSYFLGEWLGRELSESEGYSDVDLVVAVPLHLFRRMSRGYNQSDYIVQGVAKSMNVAYHSGGVKRTRSNSAQAQKQFHERWDNVDDLFKVVDPEVFKDRHVLLVDDVFTTGATMLSCAEAILDAVPSCRLSIATLAVTQSIKMAVGK